MQNHLLECAHRFKNARDVMKTKNGGFLESCALMQKAVPDHDNTKQNSVKLAEAKKKTNERWLACLFIENSDQTRCGSMAKKLREQKALKHNQYPETLNDATGTQRQVVCPTMSCQDGQ